MRVPPARCARVHSAPGRVRVAASMSPDAHVRCKSTASLRVNASGYVPQHGVQPRRLECRSVRGAPAAGAAPSMPSIDCNKVREPW